MDAFDVYLASPLFNYAEKAFNQQLTDALEAMGLTVFLPQRDGLEFAHLEGISPEERNRRVYALDVSRVESCSIVVAVLDGRVPDEGVCIELGTAREYSKLTGEAKLIVGLKTDLRTWLPDGDLNPMIAGTLDALFDNEATLLSFVSDHVALAASQSASTIAGPPHERR